VIADLERDLTRECADALDVGDVHPPIHGRHGDGTVHRAGVEVLEPESRGQRSCDRRLAGACRAVDRDDPQRGAHQLVPCGIPSL
jgi:hypothetical protein